MESMPPAVDCVKFGELPPGQVYGPPTGVRLKTACPLALHEATAKAMFPFEAPVNVAPAGAANQNPAVVISNPVSPRTRHILMETFIPPHNNSSIEK